MREKPKIPCSVQILTLNSAKTLETCLESLSAFDDIVVLDGNSTDNTRTIAQRYGARVFSQTESLEKNVPIQDFSEVRNRGIKYVKYNWFLFLDSDEYLSPEAAEEIRSIVSGSKQFSAYRLPRRYVIDGKIIERSSVYPNYQVRLFYLPDTLGFSKQVHEDMRLQPGSQIGVLQYYEYVPIDPPEVIKKKWEKYLTLQAEMFKDISFKRLMKSVKGNLTKFAGYSIKYVLTFLRGKGERMPFWFEYENAMYHVRLLWRLIKNYWKKFFRF